VEGIHVMLCDADTVSGTLYAVLGMLEVHELSQVHYSLDINFGSYKCITTAVIGSFHTGTI